MGLVELKGSNPKVSAMFKVLFLGDVVGKSGRNVLRDHLPELQTELEADLVVVNGENSAGGLGVDPGTADELFKAGADILTTGNHVWNKKELSAYLDKNVERIVRPENYPKGAPGKGWTIISRSGLSVCVINLVGSVFMTDLVDCPFAAADGLLSGEPGKADLVIVDFHAEATSEKAAFGWYLDGRATMVMGTHTHVQTADERLLPKGTAFITDVGMCGPYDSVIGFESDIVVERFRTGRPIKFELAGGPTQINGVLLEVDSGTKKAKSIQRVFRRYPRQ